MKQLTLGLLLGPLNCSSLIVNHSIQCLCLHVHTAVPGFEVKLHLSSLLRFLDFLLFCVMKSVGNAEICRMSGRD